ncbi:MAG: ferrochelatase [Campylobacterota bacterium]|nr:ferrochelatase [Campylobacterota bacterium]
MDKRKALVLLNMGAARNKDELKVFLQNMFNDKYILTIKNETIRSMIAFLIVSFRLDSAWENYEQIGGSSPLHNLTDKLISKLNEFLPDYFITPAMRYTSPFAQTAIARIKEQGIKDVILLPLYPQYSTTTSQSSIEDFIEKADGAFNTKIIEPFYKNSLYNKAICDEIIRVQNKYDDFHIIFSAHGLPQKIVDSGDPYASQIEEHVNILKETLSHYATNFKSINLAYQSKVGPMKWLTPSLDDMLKNFKNEKVIIYPIAFIIDNSETVFELDIEYREIACEIGIKEYKVCSCVNDNDTFCSMIKGVIDGSS